jgi:hypothetical protein
MNTTESPTNAPAARYEELRQYSATHPQTGPETTTAAQVRVLGVIAAIVTARFPAAKSMELHLDGGRNQVTYVGDIYDERRVIQPIDDVEWQNEANGGAPAMIDFAFELDLKQPAWGDGGVARFRKVGKDLIARVDLAAALAAPLPE